MSIKYYGDEKVNSFGEELRFCRKCRKNLLPEYFSKKRNGELYKVCMNCTDVNNRYYIQKQQGILKQINDEKAKDLYQDYLILKHIRLIDEISIDKKKAMAKRIHKSSEYAVNRKQNISADKVACMRRIVFNIQNDDFSSDEPMYPETEVSNK